MTPSFPTETVHLYIRKKKPSNHQERSRWEKKNIVPILKEIEGRVEYVGNFPSEPQDYLYMKWSFLETFLRVDRRFEKSGMPGTLSAKQH